MTDASVEAAKRLLQHRRHFDKETKKAEELEAQALSIRASTSAQKARADQGLPAADACPDCWVLRGKKIIIVHRVSEKNNKFDRWGCPECGWHFDTGSL